MDIDSPMNFTTTGLILAILAFALIAWDVALYIMRSKKHPTISQVMRKWAWYHPSIPFIVGYICGHWFW